MAVPGASPKNRFQKQLHEDQAMNDKSKLAISLAHQVMTSVVEHHPMPHRPIDSGHLDVARARSLALREIAETLNARAETLERTATRVRVGWLGEFA